VVLSQNPLMTDPALIRDIRVLETFSHGRSVYKAAAD
jgi:predicted amidohydrolase YtcJ